MFLFIMHKQMLFVHGTLAMTDDACSFVSQTLFQRLYSERLDVALEV